MKIFIIKLKANDKDILPQEGYIRRIDNPKLPYLEKGHTVPVSKKICKTYKTLKQVQEKVDHLGDNKVLYLDSSTFIKHEPKVEISILNIETFDIDIRVDYSVKLACIDFSKNGMQFKDVDKILIGMDIKND